MHVCMSVCMYTCMVLRCPLDSCARVALWIVMEVAVFEGSFVRMHAYMCVCVCMYVCDRDCMYVCDRDLDWHFSLVWHCSSVESWFVMEAFVSGCV